MPRRFHTSGDVFVDWRLGKSPAYSLTPPSDANMRIPDSIKQCVGFIGVKRGFTTEHAGTCFLVRLASRVSGMGFVYACTARHVVEEQLEGGDWSVRFNSKSGSTVTIEGGTAKWWFHPTTPQAVDFAVIPLQIPDNLDAKVFPVDKFATRATMGECGLGAGDEVFITGLFTKVPGVSQNLPIVRMGNIALVTDELIPHADGLIHAHLVEARSIGGLSGSPVFVRETLGVEYPTHILNKPRRRDTETCYVVTDTYWLLGSMVGHWDVPEKSPLLREAVNLGISLVVPCDQMLEVLNQSGLAERRREQEEARMKQGAVLDTAIKSDD